MRINCFRLIRAVKDYTSLYIIYTVFKLALDKSLLYLDKTLKCFVQNRIESPAPGSSPESRARPPRISISIDKYQAHRSSGNRQSFNSLSPSRPTSRPTETVHWIVSYCFAPTPLYPNQTLLTTPPLGPIAIRHGYHVKIATSWSSHLIADAGVGNGTVYELSVPAPNFDREG